MITKDNKMKYLSHYVEAAQTKLFNETGTFFAWSKQQYEEGKKEGVEYSFLGAGIVCPAGNVDALTDGLETINAQGIAQDLAENGKDAIIERELHNHEAFYVGSVRDTLGALEGYGITREEIVRVYKRVAPTIDY
jgi:hypothetical protein